MTVLWHSMRVPLWQLSGDIFTIIQLPWGHNDLLKHRTLSSYRCSMIHFHQMYISLRISLVDQYVGRTLLSKWYWITVGLEPGISSTNWAIIINDGTISKTTIIIFIIIIVKHWCLISSREYCHWCPRSYKL